MSSREIQRGPWGTVPLAEMKQRSPRYLFSNLLFQRRRENYRPLITQGEERTTSIFVISSTTIKHFRERAWKPETVSQGSFCPVPSLLTHKRNKNEGSSLLLCFVSKSTSPTEDQELKLLGMEIHSLGKVPLLCSRRRPWEGVTSNSHTEPGSYPGATKSPVLIGSGPVSPENMPTCTSQPRKTNNLNLQCLPDQALVSWKGGRGKSYPPPQTPF